MLQDVATVTSADAIWLGRLVHWKDRATWFGPLGDWVRPFFRKGAWERLQRTRPRDLPWDDYDWLDVVLAPKLLVQIDTALDLLANALEGAVLRSFHGCRVADAGVYHRDGLRLNDPTQRAEAVRRMVAEDEELAWLRPTIDEKLAQWGSRERDTGRLYVCADDQPQLDRIGHYMLYGSEWVTALLGFSAHRALRRRGVPTMIEVDLPFRTAAANTRREFARKLLQEWVRVTVNAPTFIPKLDFTVTVQVDLPPEMIVGHYHPEALKDPFRQFEIHETETPHCPSCAADRSASGAAFA
ncbi:hypothetical protein [Caulobacter sp. RHG1]|uniref:hypothetical protein n=1 Tax=Caulobacter sp. (strain RHG1) TaxID=2545762 RepID=UPI0015551DF1|nr:hypothetical protein [Caulobacter sp. RHG1]NQE65346.1 hypothetical protein [Caulobacter sp. RHG1]